LGQKRQRQSNGFERKDRAHRTAVALIKRNKA